MQIDLGGGAAGSSVGVHNGKLVESHASAAATLALKTLGGNDPSASDPVVINFPDGSQIVQTAALSLTVSSGSTLGATSGVAFRVWAALFNDGGTAYIGIRNCRGSDGAIRGFAPGLDSTTAEGGAGAADSGATTYSASALTSKPYVLLGYADYDSGLTTAGTWDAAPTRLVLFGSGVPKPGDIINEALSQTGAVATGSTTIPVDDTVPQNTEGTQFMSLSIIARGAANVLRVSHLGRYAISAINNLSVALFRDSGANAVAAGYIVIRTANDSAFHDMDYQALAGAVGSTIFAVRAGGSSGSTVTFNGTSGGRIFGGVSNSVLRIQEIMG